MKNQVKIPTQVYAEMTPNPATMKFVADRLLVKNGKQIDITNQADAKLYAPLADELFNFPFVTGVFISGNYVTVTKDNSLEWDMILQQLRSYVREWLVEHEWAVLDTPEVCETPTTNANDGNGDSSNKATPRNFSKSDLDDKIIALLDEYVRPAVEQDGGAIDFRGFDNGVVFVELKGACSGCPSSTQTLKGGIERLLVAELPEIKEVVAIG